MKLVPIIALISLMGCASSPETVINVQKNVYVIGESDSNIDLGIDYEANAEVDTQAELEGTVAPKTDLKLK